MLVCLIAVRSEIPQRSSSLAVGRSSDRRCINERKATAAMFWDDLLLRFHNDQEEDGSNECACNASCRHMEGAGHVWLPKGTSSSCDN